MLGWWGCSLSSREGRYSSAEGWLSVGAANQSPGNPCELQKVSQQNFSMWDNPINCSFSSLLTAVGKPQRGLLFLSSCNIHTQASCRLPCGGSLFSAACAMVSECAPGLLPSFSFHFPVCEGGHWGYHLQAEGAELATGLGTACVTCPLYHSHSELSVVCYCLVVVAGQTINFWC